MVNTLLQIEESYTCPLNKLDMFDPFSVYMKCENSYVFARTKPQSVISTAL